LRFSIFAFWDSRSHAFSRPRSFARLANVPLTPGLNGAY
jgi:hypothetical protein